ncbi:hypothetical protein WMY93_016787 [Mugilogobius chulae]|uniref:Uncharacterized protein n=1 Tax=Mugilogobius chulae TaxID=88201 RepID=A0AAW0NWI7_9GOBI
MNIIFSGLTQRRRWRNGANPGKTDKARKSHKQEKKLLIMVMTRQRRRSRYWVHPISQLRREQGDFYYLVQELRLDSERYYQYFRMSAEQMDELLNMIGPNIRRTEQQ